MFIMEHNLTMSENRDESWERAATKHKWKQRIHAEHENPEYFSGWYEMDNYLQYNSLYSYYSGRIIGTVRSILNFIVYKRVIPALLNKIPVIKSRLREDDSSQLCRFGCSALIDDKCVEGMLVHGNLHDHSRSSNDLSITWSCVSAKYTRSWTDAVQSKGKILSWHIGIRGVK